MRLEDAAVQAIIRRAKVARIGTLSVNGRPSITPLYFAVVNGHLWLNTADWTLAAREAKADPRVSVLFQVETDPHERRIIRVTGTADVRTDGATIWAYNLRALIKYSWSPGGLWNQWQYRHLLKMMRRYHAQSAAKGNSCVIDITPHHVEILDEPR